MGHDAVKTVSRSSFAFLSGTLISRLTGGLRDMSMAFCFGSSSALAAFMVAYRFANLARRLFGESPIASGFVPHFEVLRSQSPQKASFFFRDVFFSLSFFLLIVIGIVEAILLSIYHFGSLDASSHEVLYLSLIMLPGALFICLFGISSALLQCHKSFFLPGLAPVAFNLVWIAAVFVFHKAEVSSAAVGLSFAMIIAFFVHWVILLPKMLSYLKNTMSFRELISFSLWNDDVKKVIKPFFLGVLGVGAVQLNSALDAVFARYASLEGPAYLWYAIRIEQVPIGLFGVALSSALLPSLSRAMAVDDIGRFKDMLSYALKKTFALLFPCTVALFVLGCCGVNFVYGRGDFSQRATYETVLCLWGYGLGLLPTVGIMLLAPAFYAKKIFRTPAVASLLSVVVNIVLNYFFVFTLSWGALSVALATSFAAFVNMAILYICLQRKIGPLVKRTIVKEQMGTLACSFFAGAMTLLVGHYLVKDPTVKIFFKDFSTHLPRSFVSQAMHLFVLGGFFSLTLVSYAWTFGVTDILRLVGVKRGDADR